MRRRGFICGASLSGASMLLGCRKRGPTDIPVGPGRSIAPASSGGAAPTTDEPSEPDERFAALAGFCDGVPAPDTAEYAGNVARMQTALQRAGHAAIVAESSATMSWLTGARWGRSERPFLVVLPATGEPFFVCPAFEEGSAREQLPSADLALWQEHESPYAAVAKRIAKGSIAVDGELRSFITHGLSQALGGKRVVDGREVVEATRMHKSEVELARLRRANEATKAALEAAAPHVTPAMSQSEIGALVSEAQQRAGLEQIWVLALVGESAAYPHGTREDRAVRDGDLVLVDTGGSLHGYRSDITRTWAVGTPSSAARKAWETVAQAQRAALEVMRPGVTCGEVDAAARAVIEAAGYGSDYAALTHRLGHGIGLQVHEPPYLRPDNDRVLAPGMTMSNEPGIYRRGELGVRLEDIVAITEDGHEVFGPLPASLDAPFG